MAASNRGLPMPATFHGIACSSNFFDQQGAAYFRELEEALMQKTGNGEENGNGGKRALLAAKHPTLDMLSSWPLTSYSQHKESSNATESTESQNTAGSSERSGDHQHMQQQQHHHHQMMVVTTGTNSASKLNTVSRSSQEKTMRRLAQNREAARKSRLRKKAYIQQLETSKLRLAQLEHDLQRARSQGILTGGASGGHASAGATIFDMEYSRWLDEDARHLSDLRGALQAHLPDCDLRIVVEECLAHHDEIFQLKAVAAKADVFHLLNGMWTAPAERCFLWMGGFRPSELLKILIPQLDPLTEQQAISICSLQQSSLQAEEALSQGLEQLHHSLADTVAGGSLVESTSAGNYMDHMALALGKIASLEGFVRQADNLRQQTIHQMHRILTVKQAARCFLVIGEYHNRLRALSSFWASRPREVLMSTPTDGNNMDVQIVNQQTENQYPTF